MNILKSWTISFAIALCIFIFLVSGAIVICVNMPGHSLKHVPAPLTKNEIALRSDLKRHVHVLSKEIGERNWPNLDNLNKARDYIKNEFKSSGYEPHLMSFTYKGESFSNIEAVSEGSEKDAPVFFIGAHYDSAEGSPGANDNASGVAALLELARLMKSSKPHMTIRFVAFVNEEPPFFTFGQGMGSVEYGKSISDEVKKNSFMISIESIGYYSNKPGSQEYPSGLGLLYPDQGNFIAFVSNIKSSTLARKVVKIFRQHASIPSEGGIFPAMTPGVDLSDHRSFWDQGIPALMITDTAMFRDPEYHQKTDTADHMDFDSMTRAVLGLFYTIKGISASSAM